jgi:hypothetical protein
MKKMIRMALMSAAMFMTVATIAQAQGGGGGRGRGRDPMVILKDSMKVSEAILTKADSIVKSYAAVNATLMEAARGGDADARTKLTENRNKQSEAIKALLTDAQKVEYDRLMPAGGRRGGAPKL